MSITLDTSDATVILNDVNPNVGEWGILTVNAKGLVTAARPLHRSDVITALTYTPYNGDTNPLNFVTINEFPITAEPNGSTTLPNGLILQWGTTSFVAVPDQDVEVDGLGVPLKQIFLGIDATPVTFPMEFPKAVFSCTGTGVNNATYIEGCEVSVGIMKLTTAGVNFRVGRVYGSESHAPLPESGNVMWFAVGM